MALALSRPHRPPEAVDEYSSRVGLEAIAVFEAIKGVLVLAAAFGLLSLIHRDLPEVVDHMIHRLHLNPNWPISHAAMKAAVKWDGRELAAACAAFVYSAVRFVEAYGLWHCRVWAEWFAILSGCLYLPWEIFEVAVHPGPVRWGILIFNVLIVLYLVRARLHAVWAKV